MVPGSSRVFSNLSTFYSHNCCNASMAALGLCDGSVLDWTNCLPEVCDACVSSQVAHAYSQ